MNEKWKSETMISFTVYSKIKMNRFLDWNLWIKNLLNYEVVTKYKQLVIDDDRNPKTEFFDSLYIDKSKKLNIKHMFMLKPPNEFVHQVIDKIKFLALLKPLLSSRRKAFVKKNQMQLNAIIVQDLNKETMKNVEGININHTKHLDDSIAHFFSNERRL